MRSSSLLRLTDYNSQFAKKFLHILFNSVKLQLKIKSALQFFFFNFPVVFSAMTETMSTCQFFRYVTCCSFSVDGNWLATGSNDRTLKLWKICLTENGILFSSVSFKELYKNSWRGACEWKQSEVNSPSGFMSTYKENGKGNKTVLIISHWFQALLQFLYSLSVLTVW